MAERTLLICGHVPSPNTHRLFQALVAGADEGSEQSVTVKPCAALETGPEAVLACDALLLFTTENLGYMSGGMKDFFDRCYYPCLERKQGLPVAIMIRAGHDGTGTRRALESILGGLRWRMVQEPIICRGTWQEEFVQTAHELGLAMAAGLGAGIF